MFKLIVIAVVALTFVYYVDIIAKVIKDEKAGLVRYTGPKLMLPFAYWLFPYKEKKKKRNIKSKNKKR